MTLFNFNKFHLTLVATSSLAMLPLRPRIAAFLAWSTRWWWGWAVRSSWGSTSSRMCSGVRGEEFTVATRCCCTSSTCWGEEVEKQEVHVQGEERRRGREGRRVPGQEEHWRLLRCVASSEGEEQRVQEQGRGSRGRRA